MGKPGAAKMSTFHDFAERLNFSEGVEITEGILRHIRENIPACEGIRKATEREDKCGTDYWALRAHGLPPLSIDLKNRGFCPIERFGSDDVCIETTSVYVGPNRPPWLDCHRRKPGWTIDEAKRTDLLVYTWPHSPDLFGAPRLRFWILYFPFLCRASTVKRREWTEKYKEKPARNDGYLTLSVYVPRVVVAKAMRELTTGAVEALAS